MSELDVLIEMTGVNTDVELTDEFMLHMTDIAESFLRSGGRLSLTDWKGLSTASQGCFMAAQRRLDVEKALILAKAIRGGSEALELYSEIDGGKALVEAKLDARAQELKIK